MGAAENCCGAAKRGERKFALFVSSGAEWGNCLPVVSKGHAMLEFIRGHQRLMFIVLLVLIAPPFFLFGLSGYTSLTQGGTGIASVAGVPITEQDFAAAQREELQAMRQRYGAAFDAKMLDDPKQRA